MLAVEKMRVWLFFLQKIVGITYLEELFWTNLILILLDDNENIYEKNYYSDNETSINNHDDNEDISGNNNIYENEDDNNIEEDVNYIEEDDNNIEEDDIVKNKRNKRNMINCDKGIYLFLFMVYNIVTFMEKK